MGVVSLQWSSLQIRSATPSVPLSVTIRLLISRHSFVLSVTSISHACILPQLSTNYSRFVKQAVGYNQTWHSDEAPNSYLRRTFFEFRPGQTPSSVLSCFSFLVSPGKCQDITSIRTETLSFKSLSISHSPITLNLWLRASLNNSCKTTTTTTTTHIRV